MNKREIMERVGEEAYLAACEEAKAEAIREDCGRDSKNSISHIRYDVDELIWESNLSITTKLELAFDIYNEMPCYALVSGIKRHFYLCDDVQQEQVFGWMKSCMDSGVMLANPVSYALWCDYFEDSRTVAVAWNSMTDESVSETVLRTTLIASGPVPMALKRPVYERLIADKDWHEAIFRSLLHSRFDVFGQLDVKYARDLLSQLALDPATENLDKLKTELAKSTKQQRKSTNQWC